MDEIDQFLDKWVESCVTYYRKLKSEYLAFDEITKSSTKDGILTNNADAKKRYDEQQKFLQNHFGKDWDFQRTFKSNVYWMKPSQYDAWVRGIYEKEAKKKKAALIEKIKKIVGTVTQANLYIGVDSGLNGFITGTDGKCSIETIYAGGYNIQCLHFRTLIKPVKEKAAKKTPVKSTVAKLSSQKMSPTKSTSPSKRL